MKCSLGLFYLEYGVLWFWFGVGDGGGVDELVVDEVVSEDAGGHSPEPWWSGELTVNCLVRPLLQDIILGCLPTVWTEYCKRLIYELSVPT